MKKENFQFIKFKHVMELYMVSRQSLYWVTVTVGYILEFLYFSIQEIPDVVDILSWACALIWWSAQIK